MPIMSALPDCRMSSAKPGLHFGVLLHGEPVAPREWWDGHWIHDRLALKLGDALPSQR